MVKASGPVGPAGQIGPTGATGARGMTGPTGPTGMSMPSGTEVFSRPMPGYQDLRVSADHHTYGPLEIRLRGHSDGQRWDSPLGTFDENGFHTSEPSDRKIDLPDDELLCLAATRATGRLEGPRYKELVKDGFWRRYLEELPAVAVTGDVHLT